MSKRYEFKRIESIVGKRASFYYLLINGKNKFAKFYDKHKNNFENEFDYIQTLMQMVSEGQLLPLTKFRPIKGKKCNCIYELKKGKIPEKSQILQILYNNTNMKTRKELLKSPNYWMARFQTELFRCVRNYLKREKKTQTQFAEQMGVSKGYVSQIMNGDFDHKMSSFIKLSLSAGYIPEVKLTPIEEYISRDEKMNEYNKSYNPVKITLVSDNLNAAA